MMQDGISGRLEDDRPHAADLDPRWLPAAPALAGLRPAPANKRAPTDADAAVGRRIRDCRIAMGMSLGELSTQVGVSQPQLYRYESGLTRVAASRLIAVAAALGVSVEALTGGRTGPALPIALAEADLLLRAFSNIGQPERRSALIALARSMAGEALPASG